MSDARRILSDYQTAAFVHDHRWAADAVTDMQHAADPRVRDLGRDIEAGYADPYDADRLEHTLAREAADRRSRWSADHEEDP